MARTDKFIGIDFKSTDVYIKEMCMTKAEMLAFAYGADGKFTICSEDFKVYVYDSSYTDATTGHFKVASSAVFYDLDTSTTPVESWHTTSDYEGVIQRKTTKDALIGRYNLTATRIADDYTIDSAGIKNGMATTATWAQVEAGWTATYSGWFESNATGAMIRYTSVSDSNNYCKLFADYTETIVSEVKYCKDGSLFSLSGGGSGTSNYNDLSNKPQINDVELTNNKTSTDLKILWAGTKAQYDAIAIKNAQTLYLITDDNAPSVDTNCYTKAEVDALLTPKQNSATGDLQTVAKTIVGAINENKQLIAGLSGAVNIQVVATLPASPIERTIYYVGSTAPYQMKLYVNGGYTDLGTTSADLSDYVKKTDIIDALNYTSTQKPLSANQGKVLNEIIGDLTSLTTSIKTSIVNAINDLVTKKLEKSDLYKVGDVYETLSTTETIDTLATRFGGTWEAMSDRVEDTWKNHTVTWNTVNGSLTSPILIAKVDETKSYVDVQFRGNINATNPGTGAEFEICNQMKVDGTYFNSAYIDNFPLTYFDSSNEAQTAEMYVSGANKFWFGANKSGSYQGQFVGRKVVAWSSVFTPDKVFKRFKKTA